MTSSATAQADFEFNLDAPDWLALTILVRKIDEELAQRRSHLLYQTSLWLCAVDALRDFEEQRLVQAEPGARDRQLHRALLTNLLGNGEMLLLALDSHAEIDPKHIGVELADVRATVEWLRDKLAMWYGEMTAARRAEILSEVFGVGS